MHSRPTHPGQPRPSLAPLGRAIRYLGHYRNITLAAYGALLISIASQLVVPQLVQRIIDAITNGVSAQRIAAVPVALQPQALQTLGWTPEQFATYLTGAEAALITAGLLIVVFAVARAFFAFAQGYLSERVSQSVAFDFRNDLYAKIQRLSFSYHDRNQTGQLMIRATDDVEKLRHVHRPGSADGAQSFILLIGALVILLFTNFRLTLVILPVLPLAFVSSSSSAAITQPLFMKVQIKLSRLNTILQENLAGIKVVKAFVREPEQQHAFRAFRRRPDARSRSTSRASSRSCSRWCS